MQPVRQFTSGSRAGLAAACCVAVALTGWSWQAAALSESPKSVEPYGDWKIKFSRDGQEVVSMLSLSEGKGGKATGCWMHPRELSVLEDVTWENDRIGFKVHRPNRDGWSATWKFSGKIEGDKLFGVASSDRGEYEVEGERIPEMPAIVGDWAMGYTADRVHAMLAVRVGAEGKLTAEWQSEGGDVPLADFAYHGGKVTFTLHGSEYEGGLRAHNNTLSGAFHTDRGKVPLAAFRIGADIIGTWNLDITSDRGARKQRLRVLPDMSGWFGATPIKIPSRRPVAGDPDAGIKEDNLGGDAVVFKADVRVGERTVQVNFSARVTGTKLVGEITSAGGRAEVVGEKVLGDGDAVD